MNNNEVITQLEAAARIILASSTLVTNEQRQSAEAFIYEFRKTKFPYALCRHLLENSKADYVLFEASEVIKRALIREWNFLQSSDKESLLQYLLEFILNREIPSFVRDKLLQVVAIMVKRTSVDDHGKQRKNILTKVEHLILNGEYSKKLLGCYIISNMLNEYAITVKSTDVGLPWEVHFEAKKQFESSDMKNIFQFCLGLLSKISENDLPLEPNVQELTKNLLKITEMILTWGFRSALLPKRLIGIYESLYEADQAPALRLNESWKEVMFSSELLPSMFQLYWKVRNYEDLSNYALTGLVQLASLNGSIMSSNEVRLTYVTQYIYNFSKLVSSVTIKNKEALGISNIVKKLTLFFVHDLRKIERNLQYTYVEEITRLTCWFCHQAASEECSSDDEKYYNDAFDNMLEAWTSIFQEYTDFTYLHDHAIQIFDKYLQCHLGEPDGIRFANDSEREEIEDNEDNDRIRYKDQLQAIGLIGRMIPSHSLSVLYKLIEANIEKLKIQLHNMQNTPMGLTEAARLENQFEDIHWNILIAGHVLCMDSDGETPMIPSEIMHHSLKQFTENKSNLNSSLKVLASVREMNTQSNDVELCDDVIRIFSDILRLCVVEESAANFKLGQFMSPEVSCSLMWFVKRWCLSYLIPVEHYYQEVSPIIIGAVGKDTDGANFVINFILSKLQSNICHFHTEPVLLKDTVDLFTDIASVKQKSMYIVKTEGLWNLFSIQAKFEAGTIPPAIRRGLYRGFILAGTSLQDNQEKTNYYEQILKPVHTRFTTLIARQNFKTIFHHEKIQKEIADILECLIGITKGSQVSNVQILFDFISPILFELSNLLDIFNNYQVIIQSILELFGQCAKNMLCFLNQTDSKKLYEASLASIQTFARCNANRFTNERLSEESALQDLALVLDLLTFILSKDCVDFCVGPVDEEITVTASDVSLFGLNFIMPLMTFDLLKYPSLCNQYYRLLVLINDIFPEKICNLPEDLLRQLLHSVELGLTNFGTDIVQACLDFIQGMATYIFKYSMQETPFFVALKPFLKLIFDLTLSRQINSELINLAGTCIYSLICCYPEEYQLLVQTLVQQQSEPLTADRLSAGFSKLTGNIEMNCERQPRLKFRDSFEHFVVNVQGFLLIR